MRLLLLSLTLFLASTSLIISETFHYHHTWRINLQADENIKAAEYAAYITSPNPSLERIEDMYDEAHNFASERQKSRVYEAYLQNEHANEENVENTYRRAQYFVFKRNKARFYTAYLNNSHAKAENVHNIFTQAQTEENESILQCAVYTAYVRSKHAKPENILCIIRETQKFCHEKNKKRVYLACLTSQHINRFFIQQILQDARRLEYEKYRILILTKAMLILE